jgi:hypothetical protein
MKQKKEKNIKTDMSKTFSKLILQKEIQELDRYELYLSLMAVLKESSSNLQLNEWIDDLDVITKFMLVERFIQLPSVSRKSKTPRRDEDGNLLPSEKQMDTDLIRYLGIKKKNKHIPADPLSIVKFYKGLENYVISGTNSIDLSVLNLGHFTQLGGKLVDSLSILFKSIESFPLNERKWALTLLFSAIAIYRQFRVKTKPELKSLIDEYNGQADSALEEHFSKERMILWAKRAFTEKILSKDILIKFYSGNASSPNSLASAGKLLEDAWAVKNDEKLKSGLFGLMNIFEGGAQLKHFVETLFLNTCELPTSIHSRLFHFTAPGGKSRIIANVDWITQSALSGIHYWLYSLLQDLKSDSTFDHKKGLDYIYSPGEKYYSIDLSAATDRMPRFLESRLLCALFESRGMNGSVISANWEKIVDRAYIVEESVFGTPDPIRYKVGQGMGLFTSWSIMALLHHYIVNEVCKIPVDSYVLVGDDLTIRGHEQEYNKYIRVMTDIGVVVNKTKTIESTGIFDNVEFARNYIIRSTKVVPLQFGQLFAWADEKTAIETVIYNSDWNTEDKYLLSFLSIFRKYFSQRRVIHLYYTAFKYKLENINIRNLGAIFNLPSWAKDLKLEKIKKITKNEVEVYSSLILEDRSPISTLKSKLVVRTEDDVIRITELAERFIMLKFVDDEISKVAVAWHDRMNNISLIRYDVDFLGNPFITKKEIKLLDELIKYHNTK